VGPATIDLASRTVTRAGHPVRLTPMAYELLKELATKAGRVLTHRHLLRQVWGSAGYDDASHDLRVHIAHLRKKLDEDPTRPRLIRTEPGVGYRLVAPD
jgi:two-component system KDP operon response regulator KdpE